MFIVVFPFPSSDTAWVLLYQAAAGGKGIAADFYKAVVRSGLDGRPVGSASG